MPDAAAVLRANGMGLANELVQAAELERMDIAIAATIIAGESWGRNVFGHDNVPTGGTYTKGGAVTRDNYLAYRGWMRGGSGRRQGVGPAQCTSAQYQDTADALGGCWDPVANMRSGFRGMGALMRQYGTRNGARRYNGSGPQAEKYADSFMARLATWQARLNGASAPPAPAPASGLPTLREGDNSALVWRLAGFMNSNYGAYSKIDRGPGPTCRLGPQCIAALTEFQRRSGIPIDPPFAVGPKTWAALTVAGFR